MRVRFLVIDGWHKGHEIHVNTVLQRLVLMKPKTITIDNCCGGDVVGIDNDKKEYLLAGGSQDGTVAFYSEDGTMDSLFKREWITPANVSTWFEQPLYIDIHDPRAVIDYSTVENTEYDR